MSIDIKSIKQEIEKQQPLILNITNMVTMDFMANALLALGASPIMTNDPEDALELMSLCQAININIGTLDQSFIDLATFIAHQNNRNKPLILDPVGCGASSRRTELSKNLLPYCTVLRGNASEIISINSEEKLSSKGVDSITKSTDTSLQQTAQHISQTHSITIAISGEKDIIYSEDLYYESQFGTPLMTKITGMGCVLTSIIAGFDTVLHPSAYASHVSIMFYNLCGELALKKSSHPATFKNYFIDTIFAPDYDYIHKRINNI